MKHTGTGQPVFGWINVTSYLPGSGRKLATKSDTHRPGVPGAATGGSGAGGGGGTGTFGATLGIGVCTTSGAPTDTWTPTRGYVEAQLSSCQAGDDLA